MVFFVDDSPSSLKRRKFAPYPTAATTPSRAPKQDICRDFRVYATSSSSPSPLLRSSTYEEEDDDDLYEFTAEDYCRLMDTRGGDELLKMRKIREAKELGRPSTAVIRVRFPDNHTLEVAFRSSEKVQCLVDILMQVVARPDLPFYLYTTPPKNRVKDLSQDFYSAGFVPGAVLYFSYDSPQGHEASAAFSSPFLQAKILSLKNSDGVSATLMPFQIAPQLIPASLLDCSTSQTG